VNCHIDFGCPHARRTRSAWETCDEGKGGCRDYGSGDRLLPLHERPRAQLHKIPRRYRHAQARGTRDCAKFCEITVFEHSGDRVLLLLSSGGLSATRVVVNMLRQRAEAGPPRLWSAGFGSVFDVANLVSDTMRDIGNRDGAWLESSGLSFNASFILGGQIAGEGMRLFRIHAEGNFIEASTDTLFLQTGQAR
jgi:predicted proteasome-type protease